MLVQSDPHSFVPDTSIGKSSTKRCSFVINHFSYHSSVSTVLGNLQWPSLEVRRSRRFLKLVMLYKILHDPVDITFTSTPLMSFTRRHSQRFTISFARIEMYLNSFSLLLSNYGIHCLIF